MEIYKMRKMDVFTPEHCEAIFRRVLAGSGETGVLGCDDEPETETHYVPRLEEELRQAVLQVTSRGNSFRRRPGAVNKGVDGPEAPFFLGRARWLGLSVDFVQGTERFVPGGDHVPLSSIGTKLLSLRQLGQDHDSYNVEEAVWSTWMKRHLSFPGVDMRKVCLERGGDPDERIPQRSDSFCLGKRPAVLAER